MCCVDTQEPADDPYTTPDEVPAAKHLNPHDQTVNQVPHTYQPSNMNINKVYLPCCPTFPG